MMPDLPEPMTIEQLKNHMDRRFDRLQRTKANKSDLRGFATETGLKRFATKEDLKRFATKEDLKRFATKKDLQRFATKKDLERYATKADLKAGLDRIEDRIASMQKTLEGMLRHHGVVLDDHEVRIRDLEHTA
jgi:glutaredoxin 2